MMTETTWTLITGGLSRWRNSLELAVDGTVAEAAFDALKRSVEASQSRIVTMLPEERYDDLETRQVVVGVGPGERRQQVVDHHRMGPSLGLGSLAGIVPHERVHEGEVAQGGSAGAGQAASRPSKWKPPRASLKRNPPLKAATMFRRPSPVTAGGTDQCPPGSPSPGTRRRRSSVGSIHAAVVIWLV